jgi:hypothetical protein
MRRSDLTGSRLRAQYGEDVPDREPTKNGGGRALLARINRALAAKNEQVRKTRAGSADRRSLGRHYSVNQITQKVLARRLDLEDMAGTLGVLTPYGQRRERAMERRRSRNNVGGVCALEDCQEDGLFEVDEEFFCRQHLVDAVRESVAACEQIREWLVRRITWGRLEARDRALVEQLADDIEVGDPPWGSAR